MKRIFTILLVMISLVSFSQKVKIKKDIVSIDEVEVYKIDEEGKSMTLSTMAGNEFITMLRTVYKEWRNGYEFSPSVCTIKFLSNGQEVLTDMSDKDIIKVIYKSGMVNADGKIDEDKANIFINKYNDKNLKLKIK